MFLRRERFPLSSRQTPKCDVHDSNAMQTDHPVPQRLTHPPDLAVATFGQDDSKPLCTEALDPAGPGLFPQDHHSRGHAIEETAVEGTIKLDLIFPFMTELAPQDVIDNVAVVGEENES